MSPDQIGAITSGDYEDDANIDNDNGKESDYRKPW